MYESNFLCERIYFFLSIVQKSCNSLIYKDFLCKTFHISSIDTTAKTISIDNYINNHTQARSFALDQSATFVYVNNTGRKQNIYYSYSTNSLIKNLKIMDSIVFKLDQIYKQV